MVLAATHNFHLERFGSKTVNLLSFPICGIEVLTYKEVYLVLDFGSIWVAIMVYKSNFSSCYYLCLFCKS